MLGGGVDAATLVAALGAGPPPPDCRWGRRPHRGATACRLLERDDRGVDGPGVEGDSRLGELLEVERDEGLRAAARVAVMRAVFGPRRLEPGCEELEGRDRVRSGAAKRLDKHEDDLGLLDVDGVIVVPLLLHDAADAGVLVHVEHLRLPARAVAKDLDAHPLERRAKRNEVADGGRLRAVDQRAPAGGVVLGDRGDAFDLSEHISARGQVAAQLCNVDDVARVEVRREAQLLLVAKDEVADRDGADGGGGFTVGESQSSAV